MTPEQMRGELLTSPVTGLPNRRAFAEAGTSSAVAMSDADGLKALMIASAMRLATNFARESDALREAGLEAYHDKATSSLPRQDPEQLQPS